MTGTVIRPREPTAMVEPHGSAASTFWRWVRIIGLSLATVFLLGMAIGFVGAHIDEGGGFGLRSAGILALILLALGGCGWLLKRDFQSAVPGAFGAAASGEGERLYASRSRKLWRIVGGLAAIGFVLGVAGSLIWHAEDGAAGLAPWIVTLLAVGIVIASALAVYGSWRFFVSVDEVEVADNLWGSLIGFYAYAILFPAWWALNQLERAPEINHWAIYGVSMAAAVGAYAFRKWRSLQ